MYKLKLIDIRKTYLSLINTSVLYSEFIIIKMVVALLWLEMESSHDKFKLLTIVLILSCVTIGSLSVTGLLQSTERVGSSGIVVVPAPLPPIIIPSNPPSPPPPEPAVEIDVFSNSACTQVLTQVTWGQIEAGDHSTRTVYVKNNGDTGVVLSLNTDSWGPSNAENYMTLTWNYNGAQISPGEVASINLTLNVSSSCPALSSFNFDIIIVAS